MKRISIAFVLMTLCLAVAPSADQPKPFADFQAKRVKPPAPGTKKRINVQIEPQEEVVTAAPSVAPSSPTPDGPGKYAWFWETVAPVSADGGPWRLDQALQALKGPDTQVSTPRLQTLQNIAKAHNASILGSTVGTQISPALVLAVIAVESGGRIDAESGAGAQGLMQLMPATASRFGVNNSLEPNQNISGGVRYLDWLMQEFGQDPILVLAGYNAGEGAVRSHSGVPPYAETRDYVPKVLAAFAVAKGLCQTPPELISDGCVFVR